MSAPARPRRGEPAGSPVRPRNLRRLALGGAAALALALGYADLARGGETVAPILLVVGYCLFVPAAVLARPRRARVST